MGCFSDRAQIPSRGLPRFPQHVPGVGAPAHCRTAFFFPSGEGEIPLHCVNAALPLFLVHIFAAKIIQHAGVRGIFLYGGFQQRQIRAPGFNRIGIVIEYHVFHKNDVLRHGAGIDQILMNRVIPEEPLPGMDLRVIQLKIRGAVCMVAPVIQVFGAGRIRPPDFFQSGTPSGRKHLIKIGANADICVFGNVKQREIARAIEPPGPDNLLIHHGPFITQTLYGAVGGSGVGYNNLIRLPHRIHPPVYKLFLIFTNGIYADQVRR